MVTNKRQRQRATREARERAIRARQKKQARQRIWIILFTAVVLVLGVSAFVVGGGGGTTAQSGDSTTVPAATGQPVTLSSVPPGATISGDTPCPKADGSSPRTTKFAKAPPMCIDTAHTYTAEVTTSKGRFTISLDTKAAPKTVNNFVVLARYKYFEGIPFHRIIPNFVVQGGDPTATGGGEYPGYKFEDELPKQPSGAYKSGSVAMANSGPNTNGSQFFIVTGPAGEALNSAYSLFGTVTEGMDVVKSIEAVGTTGGQPTQAIIISSVIIKES